MKFIPQGLSRSIGRQILTVKKDSPRLLFGLGLAGTVVSTVLACRATLKLEDVLDDFQAEVSGQQNRKQRIPDGGYTRSEYNRDMALVYAKGTGNIARLYGPSILVGTAAISCLTGSHVVLEKRNAGLTAAYSALQLSYNEYRKRVIEQIGQEKELDVYHSAKTEKLHEDGVKTVVKRADPNTWSQYSRFFDETNINWYRNSELNRMFVQCQQTWANDLLKSRGHIFLNEVYDMLGFPRTKAGAVVGWVLGNGDDFVDFGLYSAASSQFINGWEQSIVLDFNVDGVVYDLI